MDYIWQYGGYMMSINRMRQLTYIGLIVGTIGIWYSIFTIGFFITLFYLISISFTIGIYLRYLENRKG